MKIIQNTEISFCHQKDGLNQCKEEDQNIFCTIVNFCCTSTQFQIGQQHGNCKSKAISQTAKMIPVASIFYYVFRDLYDAKKINSCVYHHDNTNYTQKYISSITIITHYKLHNEKCMSCIIPSIFQCFWQSTTKNDNKIFAYSGF